MPPCPPQSRGAWGAIALRLALVALLCSCLLGTLAGCRDSDELTERVLEAGAPPDESLEPFYQNIANADPMELASVQVGDSNRVDYQVEELPRFDELPDDVQESIKAQETQHSSATPDETQAMTGSEEPDERPRESQAGSSKRKDTSSKSKSGKGKSEAGGKSAGDDSDSSGPGKSRDSNADLPDVGGIPTDDEADDQTGEWEEISPVDSKAGGDQSDNPGERDDDEGSGLKEPDSQDKVDDAQGGDKATGGDGKKDGGVVVGDGEYAKLPSGTSTIAACGQYALLTQMIGGSGALVAADEEWLSGICNSAAFPGEGLDKVPAAWSGDGTAFGSADIDKLVELEPDTVLVGALSGGVNDEESQRLSEAGINVVVMPELGEMNTIDDDIVLAARIIGELLKDHENPQTGKKGSAMANDYVSLHDRALDDTRSANGGNASLLNGVLGSGYLSLNVLAKGPGNGVYQNTFSSGTRTYLFYVDGWAHCAKNSFSFTHSEYDPETKTSSESVYELDSSSGLGVGPRHNPAVNNLFGTYQYYFQAGGVQDADFFYLASIGATYGNWWDYDGHYSPEIEYVSPAEYYQLSDAADRMLAYFEFAPYYGRFEADVIIGEERYPGYLARDINTAKRVEKSAKAANGWYNPRATHPSTGYQGSDNSKPQDDLTFDVDSLDIWVAPSGVAGSWMDGTVESFLLAPWVLGITQPFKGVDFLRYATPFYSEFYRCNASGTIADYDYKITVSY